MVTSARHVVGLVEGSIKLSDLVDPFIRDGIAAGERVVYLVESPEGTIRKLGAQMDASTALASGQLDVRAWSATYLDGGGFEAPRMLARVRRVIRETESLGFKSVRIIGDMGWAVDGTPGVGDLVAYEGGINAIAARPRVAILCAYDTAAISPVQLAALLAAHDAALSAGTLQRIPEVGRRRSARERILDSAGMLFSENGVSRTGVDTLIAAAGVAKATFYRQFPAKDDLVVAWLRDPRTRWFDGVKATAEASATSLPDLVGRLFDGAAAWLGANDFVGCPYLNTAVELQHPGPGAEEARAYLGEIGAYLEAQLAAAERPDAVARGRELHLMLAGAITLGVANRTTAYLEAARDAALQRLTDAPTSSRGRRRRRGPDR